MKLLTPIKPKKEGAKDVRHKLEYSDFVLWVATPKALREPSTQRELAKKFGVGEDTLSDWKNKDGFWDSVALERVSWTREKTSDVIHALYKRATETGRAHEARLWMEIVEGLTNKEVHVIDRYADIREMSDDELKKEKNKLMKFFSKR